MKNISSLALGRLISPAVTSRAKGRSYPILSMTRHDGLVDQSTKFKKRVASADTSDYKVVRRDQLVVGFPIDEGVLSIQDMYDEAIVSPAYNVWNIRSEFGIEPAYLERFLRSNSALSFYRAKLRGTTARRRTIPNEVFLGLRVPLPDQREQRRITDILDKADTLRAKRRAALAQLDTLTQSIFLDMFGDRNRETSWPERSLGSVLASLRYGPRFYNEAYSEDGVRVVRITDLDDSGCLSFETMPRLRISSDDFQKFVLRPGDIIFARTGATVGKTALIREGDPPCIAGAYFIVLRFDQSIDPKYARAVLSSSPIRALIAKRSRQAAQQNFSGPGVRQLSILIPPLALQREYSRRAVAIEKAVMTQQTSLTNLNRLITSLQHRAFRGEL